MTPGTGAVAPEILPLVELTHGEIDCVLATVPEGAAGVQDIYPLTSLQEGMLFHHVLAQEGDPYVISGLLAVDSRERLDAFLDGPQKAVERHDVLRTAVVWRGLPLPVQVVRRHAELAARVRGTARAVEVSPATLFHVAWGRAPARTTGQDDAVFGTVLFGRGGADAQRGIGAFINTLRTGRGPAPSGLGAGDHIGFADTRSRPARDHGALPPVLARPTYRPGDLGRLGGSPVQAVRRDARRTLRRRRRLLRAGRAFAARPAADFRQRRSDKTQCGSEWDRRP
ncbi:condensation domain-containing protein [Streptomyces sp. NPDC058614]|uniref:condensation domain-containing protein n=1 Tax=Streptomyces sp. NPDC058614 TaxID=3346557 RepID=UPI00364F6967